jgi:tyrosine-protein kinase Etk/Wzc
MASTSKPEESNEFLDLLDDLWKYKVSVFLLLFLSMVLGVFASYWVRPEYKVNALLQIETKKSSGGFMGDLGSLFSTGSPAETEIELVQSRRVIGAAVDASGLQFVSEPLGFWKRLRHKEGRLDLQEFTYPKDSMPDEIRSTPWMLVVKDSTSFDLLDPLQKKVLSGEVGKTASAPYLEDSVRIGVLYMDAQKGDKFKVYKRSRLAAIEAFSGAFSVSEKGKKTGILEFTYQDIYPDRAVSIVNQVANAYLRQNVEQRSAEAQKTLSFLEKQIPEVKSKLDSAEAELNSYRYQVGSVDINTETKIVLEKQMKLQQQILELQQKKEEAVRLFNDAHPMVMTMDRQIESIRSELSGMSMQVRKLPAKQQEILRLTSEVELDKLLYTNMLNNIQQLRLVSAGEMGSVRIVDYAELVTKPVKPKKKLIFILALFLGFSMSVLYVTIRKKLHSGVKDSRVIERELGLSVYAKIPKGGPTKQKHMPLALSAPDDLAIESMRTLRTSLEFMLSEQGSNVVVLSGLIPAVGKSFVSINLGALFAAIDKKVLLIDADLRKGRLHKEFGLRKEAGLSDTLTGKESLDSVLNSTSISNLSVITAGRTPASPAELLGSQKFSKLLEDVKSRFDVIIIDTPPIMLVTDAMLVCRHADQAVMVIEYNRHSIEAIREGLNLFTKGVSESVHKSVVINKYVHSKIDGYGYKYGKY